MPEFGLNKLVRDGLKNEYEKMGQVVEYVELTPEEHKQKLIIKIIEEASEIDISKPAEEIASEIADIQQVINDLMTLCDISEQQVQEIVQAKFEKKQGFINGTYVKTLKLSVNDEWVDYYRKKPDVFPENK